MGALKIKKPLTKAQKYMKDHGYIVVAPGQKPPRRQRHIVVNDEGKRVV